MSSRAALLLTREYNRLEHSSSLKGISYSFVNCNVFHWHITLQGLEGTPWEGGIFQVDMHFDESYNNSPPSVFFLTVPFHPNIDISSGKPCISFLDNADEWKPSISLETILVQLQVNFDLDKKCMLSEPCLDGAINPAAADIFMTSPRLYSQLVQDSVVASRRVYSGLSVLDEKKDSNMPYEKSIHDIAVAHKASPKKNRSIINVSFESYHSDWKSMGTSISPPFQSGSHKATMSPMIFQGISQHAKMTKDQYQNMMQRQHLLWYGCFNQPRPCDTKQALVDKNSQMKNERIESMRRIYTMHSDIGTGQRLSVGLVPTQNNYLMPHLLHKEDSQSRTVRILHSANKGEIGVDQSGLGVAQVGKHTPSTGTLQFADTTHSNACGIERVGGYESSSPSTSAYPALAHTITGEAQERMYTELCASNEGHAGWEIEADDLVKWSKDLPG
ncbi:hypothetical protein BASA50_011229 [Batrachochytrium salamandrivorans]|uniref:UBC core domain-containing protein n=1 Tax=Batrachochytrium salamandrivorans TaxID=1357716 RepID=A0ABQ8EX70_9FUNG|nr:hypothetical protein BASA62_009768 [Batrachochytrium salamandrivorans]KAH6587626.1 hypothetical protein BASA50_011229 [Batrachochytrium salamandrivorans]